MKRRSPAPKPVWQTSGPTSENVSQEKRNFSGLIITLVILVAAALLIGFLPSFYAAEIEVTPTRAMSTAEIQAASGLETGQHLLSGLGGSLRQLFSLRYGTAEQKLIQKFPYIRTVEARLDFPARIKINIEERIEVSYLAIPDGCVLVDKEGYALRILPQSPTDIPLVEGITVRQMSIGSPLTVDLPESMNVALSLMGAIIDANKDTRSSVNLIAAARNIRPVSNRDVYLTLLLPSGDELTVLARASADLVEDMIWLRFAIEQGALSDRGKGVLDLTGDRKVFIPDKT